MAKNLDYRATTFQQLLVEVAALMGKDAPCKFLHR